MPTTTRARKLVTGQASHEIRPGTIEGFGKTMGLRLADGQPRRGRRDRGRGADGRRDPVDA